jgi:RNA polymerase sigma factor (sigma-70 family)
MSMLGEQGSTVVRDLEQVFAHGTATGLSEGQLLRRFVGEGDEVAFSTLVARHGAMVLGVCRRVLGTLPDADDAFQATFLVLLRRATGLQDAESLGPWLYGVAWRVASRARTVNARRRIEEGKAAVGRPDAALPAWPAEQRELRAVLDEEINRLPEKYRRPLVLCYLEGLTQEAAARRLRWKAGVLRGRLDRGRLRLRGRLARRGLAPAAILAVAEVLQLSAQGAVPASLVSATIGAARGALGAGKFMGKVVTSSAAGLAGDVLRRQLLGRTAVVAALLMTSSLVFTGLYRFAAFAGIGSLGLTGTGREAAGSLQNKAIPPADRTIDFRVVDRSTGKALAGVRLTVIVGPVQTVDRTTDDTGGITFDYPFPRPKSMHVGARKEGFTSMIVWVNHPAYDEEFPARYTLAMAPVGPISGVVKDEQGRPVAGAKVSPGIFMNSDDPRNRAEFHLEDTAMTDAGGRWTCWNVPMGYDPARFSLQIQHADFQPFRIYGGKVTEAIGPKGAAILSRGFAIAGRVVDREGHPVRGARVRRGDAWAGSDQPIVETDQDGRFRLEHVPGGEATLTAQAKGHGPAVIKFDVRPEAASAELKLGIPRTIVGRVVDAQGKPVAGVQVAADGWRRLRTLDWKTDTGSDGRFRWDDAPRDPVWITAYGEGFIAVRNREVPVSEAETIIKVTKVLTITGTVLDSRTRKPIEAFTLIPGMVDRFDESSTYWNRRESSRRNGGRYEIRFTEPADHGHRLRIDAEGYAPGISRPIADEEGDAKVDFELIAGESIAGVVRLAGGAPVEGADVVLVVPSAPAFINNGRAPVGLDHRVVKTGADGRYAFSPEEPPFTLLALHDRGFAQVRSGERARGGELVIQPWGRVEGTVRLGSRPGVGLPLLLNGGSRGDTEHSIPWFEYSATADRWGKFVFERVVPGSVTVARKIELSDHSYSSANTTEVEVKPDRTTTVALGGTGRPVIGRVIVPEGLRERVDWGSSLNHLTAKRSMLEKAGGLLGMTGKASASDYAVKVEADGSFRIEDVVNGSYKLRFLLQEAPSNPYQRYAAEPIAGAHREVTVPEMSGGRSDQPLDLGEVLLVAMPARKVVKVSELAPGFRVETLDGKALDLGDYRGRYVLLDFWATWCGPCVEETPFLKATFDAFGQDKRFAMIGLSLDKSKDAPRNYAVKNELRWTQGFLGDWSKTTVPEEYGVNGIPAIWLIGPDGRVVAKDLRGNGIKKAVGQALGNQ